MEVRVLGPDDVALLESMLSLFGRAFDDPDSYDTARPGPDYLAGLLGNPAFVAVAAVHDGAVGGGLAAYVLPKFEQARDDAPAVALYSKLGVRQDVLHFDIPPHPRDTPDRRT